MRGLSARRIASTALGAALLAGVTGPAATAADNARERGPAVSAASLPRAKALMTRANGTGGVGTVLNPQARLLNAVLKADNGRLSAAERTRLANAATKAVAHQRAGAGMQAEDAAGDALAGLRKALDALRKAATYGDVGQVGTAVDGVETALDKYVTAVLGGSGLPVSMPTPTPSVPGV
jgi:hypothetical protein